MSSECSSVSLDELGVLRVRGAQVVSFLQGQVSNDVALLGPARSLLAGYHNPQGRVIALLRLGQAAAEHSPAIPNGKAPHPTPGSRQHRTPPAAPNLRRTISP